MYEDSPGNTSVVYVGGKEAKAIFDALRQYVANERSFKNIIKLHKSEEILERNTNELKNSVEKTLYIHMLPTSIYCPFIK